MIGGPAPIIDKVRELMQRAQGVSIGDLMAATGCGRGSASQAMWRMFDRGEAFKGVRGRTPRLFANPICAAAYKNSLPAGRTPKQRPNRVRASKVTPKHLHKKPGPQKGTPRPMRVKPAQMVFNTSLKPIAALKKGAVTETVEQAIARGVKTQVLIHQPTYARHQLAPGVLVRGEFSALRLGQYLDCPAA